MSTGYKSAFNKELQQTKRTKRGSS